jgi:pyruvate/2-oxoglutarate dehydrogenase complex dihydrolipoamide dehydrogenase (E3) component
MSRDPAAPWPELIPWSSDERSIEPVDHGPSQVGSGPGGTRQPADRYDLAVIGAGAAGMAAALGAADLGARVALIERRAQTPHVARGGSVCARALFQAAHIARQLRATHRFGLRARGVELDFGALMAHIRALDARASSDTLERAVERGIDVFFGEARFVDRETLDAAGCRIRFKRALIATGGHPAIAAIEGLDDSTYLSPDSIFSLADLPARLVIVGGGATGCEFAQAFARLGSQVTLIEASPRLLPEEDPDVSEVVQRAFAKEGITVVTGTEVVRVESLGSAARRVHAEQGLSRISEDCDQILIASGLAPNIGGLALELAGVEFDKYGVRVDDFLRTSNARIFAAGDVCSSNKSAQAAVALGRVALRNALSWRRVRRSSLLIPCCTYTDPQVARVGFRARDAADAKLACLTVFARVSDGGLNEAQPDGFARVYYRGHAGRIAGATLVAADASELVGEVTLAIGGKHSLATIASTVHPHPTQSELLKRLADEFMRQSMRPSLRVRLTRWLRS